MPTQLQAQYIICRDKLPTQVTVTHGSLDAAKAEAERLARKQNDRFMVFELIGVVGPTQPPVAWTWREEIPAAEHFDDTHFAVRHDLIDPDDLDSDDLGDDRMGDIDPDDGEPFGAKG